MDFFSSWLAVDPIVSFTIFLLASLIVPPLVERIRLPGLVGLLLSGMVLGPYGLRLLSPDSETVQLLSDIGKVYLMFVAGLEIDMRAFRKTRNRALVFGGLTFSIPLMTGMGLGLVVGMGLNSSILLGSLLASHTLLAYPLMQRLGVARHETVALTVGATIFTDIGALLILAICVSVHRGEFTWISLWLQLIALALYAGLVLVGLDRLGRAYFRFTGSDEGNQFLFILLALLLASVGAQAIHTENIVGAFLAGIAVNDVLGRSAVKEKIEFVGTVLFIPFFFIAMGLLIDIPIFTRTLLTNFPIILAVVLSLFVSKFLAAWGIKKLYDYRWSECLTMWSLSLPQVAATLAAAWVGYDVGLLSETMFNSVIVLMLVTATLGPVLTRHYASQLKLSEPQQILPKWLSLSAKSSALVPLNVVVPLHNPDTEPLLIELAGRLAKQQQGYLFPLVIVKSPQSWQDTNFKAVLDNSQKLLAKAVSLGQTLDIPTHTLLRIDQDIAAGICHSSYEHSAQLIVMGYGDMITLQARLLGSVVDQVFRYSPAAVVGIHLRCTLLQLNRVIIPVQDLHPQLLAHIQFAEQLATAIQSSITILFVPPLNISDYSYMYQQLEMIVDKVKPTQKKASSHRSSPKSSSPKFKIKIKVIPHPDIVTVVTRAAHPTDLVLLHWHNVNPVRDLPVSGWGTPLLQELTCSIGLFQAPAL